MITNLIVPIVLQIVAIAVIIIEFILPSAGILTLLSLSLFGYSLFLVFTNVSTAAGFVFVALDVLLVPVLILIGIKLLAASPVTLKATLSSKDGASSQPPEASLLLGKQGTTLTDLRPSGSADIEGKRYDVISKGDYIPKGTAIKVSLVDGNRIVVKSAGEMAQ